MDELIKLYGGRPPTTEYSVAKKSRASGSLGDPSDEDHFEKAARNLERDMVAIHGVGGLSPLLTDGTFGIEGLAASALNEVDLASAKALLGRALTRVGTASRRAKTTLLADNASRAASLTSCRCTVLPSERPCKITAHFRVGLADSPLMEMT